jgi:hypothetical protein
MSLQLVTAAGCDSYLDLHEAFITVTVRDDIRLIGSTEDANSRDRKRVAI